MSLPHGGKRHGRSPESVALVGEAWSGWQAYATGRSWKLPSGEGRKVVYVQFLDGAGNASPMVTDSIYKTR